MITASHHSQIKQLSSQTKFGQTNNTILHQWKFYLKIINGQTIFGPYHKHSKAKLALYKLLLSFYESCKELYISNKMEYFSCKGGYGVHVSRHLK